MLEQKVKQKIGRTKMVAEQKVMGTLQVQKGHGRTKKQNKNWQDKKAEQNSSRTKMSGTKSGGDCSTQV